MSRPFNIFSTDRVDHYRGYEKIAAGGGAQASRARSAPRRPSSGSRHGSAAPGARVGGTKTAFKSHPKEVEITSHTAREDLLSELQELKRKMRILAENAAHIKSENQRLEVEGLKQQRRIDQLMSHVEGAKNIPISAEIRKDLEKSVLVRQLKSQIVNMKNEITERDAQIEILRRDLKSTHIAEVEFERDEGLAEIKRLRAIIVELKEELVLEKKRREWSAKIYGGGGGPDGNGDDIRREVARLASGYQNILSTISGRAAGAAAGIAGASVSGAGPVRPASANATLRSGHHGRAVARGGGRSRERGGVSEEDEEYGVHKRLKRPQSANGRSSAGAPSLRGGAVGRGTAADGYIEESPSPVDPIDNFGVRVGLTEQQLKQSLLAQQIPTTATPIIDAGDAANIPGALLLVPPTRYRPGDRVQGRYGGGRLWYDGTVSSAVSAQQSQQQQQHTGAAGATCVVYEVRYDDGAVEVLSPSRLRPAASSGASGLGGLGVDGPLAAGTIGLGMDGLGGERSTYEAAPGKSPPKSELRSSSSSKSKFKVGDLVEALYYNGQTWYAAKVELVHLVGEFVTQPQQKGPLQQSYVYDLLYDDGDREKKVKEESVRFRGDNTATPSAGVSPNINSDTAGVTDKGNSSSSSSSSSVAKVKSQEISPRNLKPSPAQIAAFDLEVGTKVEAPCGGGSTYYPGVVARVCGGGLYDIRFDDGDEESAVASGRINLFLPDDGAALAVGSNVEARYRGLAKYYPGTISTANNAPGAGGSESGGTYDIAYDDGENENGVSRSLIRLPPISAETVLRDQPHLLQLLNPKIQPGKRKENANEKGKDQEREKQNQHEQEDPKMPLSVGMEVEARYKGLSKYYPGRIKCINSDGTCDIDYHDGEQERRISWDLIRVLEPASADVPVASRSASRSEIDGTGGEEGENTVAGDASSPQQLVVGAVVEANYRGLGKHYSGVIERVHGDGFYAVAYDDGEREERVKAELVRAKKVDTKPLAEGAVIEANYEGLGRYYPGKVHKCHLESNTYDIAFDDGEFETGVRRDLIREVDITPPDGGIPVFEGSRVEVRYQGLAVFYPGRVSLVRDNGECDIDYDDGEKETKVKRHLIQVIEETGPLEEGAVVEARYRGKQRFFRGVIKRCHSDGKTYDILYDDGEKEKKVERSLIRAGNPLSAASASKTPKRHAHSPDADETAATTAAAVAAAQEAIEEAARAAAGTTTPSPRRTKPQAQPQAQAQAQAKENEQQKVQRVASSGVAVSKAAKMRAEIQRAFGSINRDHTGDIDSAEFHRAITSLGIALSHADVDALFARFDVDRSGTMNLEEFFNMLDFSGKTANTARSAANHLMESIRSRLLDQFGTAAQCRVKVKEVFAEMDRDKSGALERREFTNAAKRLSFDLNSREVDIIFKRFDLDKSNNINYEEFVNSLDLREVDISPELRLETDLILQNLGTKLLEKFGSSDLQEEQEAATGGRGIDLQSASLDIHDSAEGTRKRVEKAEIPSAVPASTCVAANAPGVDVAESPRATVAAFVPTSDPLPAVAATATATVAADPTTNTSSAPGEPLAKTADCNVGKSYYAVESKVEARFGGDVAFYPGKITRVHITDEEDLDEICYDILYDDGDRELRVAAELVRLISPPLTSETVCHTKNNNNNNSSDSSSGRGESVPVLSVGMRVESRYGGLAVYYPGKIIKVHEFAAAGGNGSGSKMVVKYDILYDDGDKELKVDAEMVRAAPADNGKSAGEGSGAVGSVAATDTEEAAPLVAARAVKLAVGTKVESRYGGLLKYYPGKIVKVYEVPANSGGRDGGGEGGSVVYKYDVLYDDGDKELKVDAEMVRELDPPPETAQSAHQHHPVVHSTNLDDFLGEISDDDDDDVGLAGVGGVDAVVGAGVGKSGTGGDEPTGGDYEEDDFEA